MSALQEAGDRLRKKLASASRTRPTPTDPLLVEVIGTWHPVTEGICEGHNWIVRYNLAIGYQRHLDGSPCEEIIMPLERP